MTDQSSRNPAPALFATAETLTEFRLAAPESLPDARTACHAADAWARVSGRRAVFVSVGLEETLDALPTLATPYGDEIEITAVCVLGNDQALEDVYESGRHLAHHVLRLEATGRKRGDAGARKTRIKKFVVEGRAGVQLLLIPWALSNGEIRSLIESVLKYADGPSPETRAVSEVQIDLAGLATARRPILVPGRRTLMANDPGSFAALARDLGAAVVLTTAAAGAPPDTIDDWRSRWPVDVPLISGAGVVWNYALIRSDWVGMVGGRLTEGEMFGLRDFAFVRADKVQALPEELLRRDPVLKKFRDRHRAAVSARVMRLRAGWCAKLEKKSRKLEKLTAAVAGRARKDRAPFDPAWVSQRIFAQALENTLFVGEGNGAGMWMWSYNQLRPTLYPDRMATIGLMLPWVLGAGRAAPERPIWCFAGDGSLGYQPDLFRELSQSAPNAVVFVFNNRAWSSIRLEQTFLFRGRHPGTKLPARNFAKLARSHGCEGLRVETEAQFLAALKRARRRRDRPLVVDIPMPRDGIPFAGLSFALAELDYLLKPMIAPFVASVIRAAAVGTLSVRIPRMLLRMVLP